MAAGVIAPIGHPLFLDLPQEIRDLIYLYFRKTRWVDITQMPAELEQPSISHVSRLVRREALDVFYGKNRFMLDLRGWKHPFYPRKWTPSRIFHQWISAVGDENAARLRHFIFYSHNFIVYFNVNPEASPQISSKFRLTRPVTNADVSEEVPRTYTFYIAAQRAEKRLNYVVRNLPAVTSNTPLTHDDLRILCDTVESIQPVICTRYSLGYMGAVLSDDETAAPSTALHKEKCEECGYHRITEYKGDR